MLIWLGIGWLACMALMLEMMARAIGQDQP